MTTVSYGADGLEVQFPGWERWMTRRARVVVPDVAIRAAGVEPGWTSEVLGMRHGLVVTGLRKLGTFTHPNGRRRLVSMRRGRPLLRVEVDRDVTGFDELLLSTTAAPDIAGRLKAREGA